MAQEPNDRVTISEYLLGQLPDSQRQDFEQRLVSDDKALEELLVGEDELIDAYLKGELEAEQMRRFESLFLATSERQDKLRFGRAFMNYVSSQTGGRAVATVERATPARWSQLFASPTRFVVYAILIVGVAVASWLAFFGQSDIDKGLIALNTAYRQQRPVEARISNFTYAPYATTRGPGTDRVDQKELRRAELTLLEALDKKPTAAVHHALGKVYLAKKHFDVAVGEFDEALKGDPKNAQLYSDLGAAYLENARIDLDRGRANPTSSESGKGLEDLVRSFEALNKAVELNPNLLEALFNRALVYQAMVLPQQAEEDWKKYLEKDHNSRWADEARRHLNDLEESKKARSQNKAELLPEFVAAYRSNNDDKASELISKNTEAIAGQLVWWQLAGAYLNAASRPENGSAAHSYLEALAYAGRLQEKRGGDRFVSELARFYGSCSPARLAVLAEAHTTIDQAHALMSRSDAAEALKLYEKAKVVFDKASDKGESLFAVYWIGYCRYHESDFKESLSVFAQLAEQCRARHNAWLLEKALTMMANIQLESGQFSNSVSNYRQSLDISEGLNDVYNLQKNLSSLAYAYKNLGDRQESLAYMQRCLQSAVGSWPGGRQMYRNYYAAAGILNSFRNYAAAAAYEKAALQLALEEVKDPGFAHQSYVHLGAIEAKLQNFAEALRYAELSYQAAKMVDHDSSLRLIADSSLQAGHIYRQAGDYTKAISKYDEAVRLYDGMKLFSFLYDAHKGKLLSYIPQGNDVQAQKELPTVLALFEQHRGTIKEEKNRNSFFDLEQNVYDIAIDFEYSRRRDSHKAFEYSEVSRARSLLDLMNSAADESGDDNPDIVIPSLTQPLTLTDIRDRMPEEVQILQYAVLDDKLLTWVISRNKFEVAEQKISSKSLTEKVQNYSRSVSTISESGTDDSRRAGVELYEMLIKPVESLLDKDKQICIVPDKVLNRLPFNVLISPATGKYLISDFLLSFAPSSNVFLAASEAARRRSGQKEERLLSIGDPHFDRDAFPDLPDLPSSGKEAEQIAEEYKSPWLLVGDGARKERIRSEMDRADVIHIASHYLIDEQNPMLSKLLLTAGAGEVEKGKPPDGSLEAYEIYKRKLPITRLVALSACRTGLERYYSGEGMIGMSRTFLAAGVPLVAASLWPVDSNPTADLMTSFHRYRKRAGFSSAVALRQAQLDMLNSPERTYDRAYYWASFVLIGGYASF